MYQIFSSGIAQFQKKHINLQCVTIQSRKKSLFVTSWDKNNIMNRQGGVIFQATNGYSSCCTKLFQDPNSTISVLLVALRFHAARPWKISLSTRVSAFISLALVVVLVLHTILYDIRLYMSILPSIYTYHSYTLNICTRPFTIIVFIIHYYIITVVVLCGVQ